MQITPSEPNNVFQSWFFLVNPGYSQGPFVAFTLSSLRYVIRSIASTSRKGILSPCVVRDCCARRSQYIVFPMHVAPSRSPACATLRQRVSTVIIPGACLWGASCIQVPHLPGRKSLGLNSPTVSSSPLTLPTPTLFRVAGNPTRWDNNWSGPAPAIPAASAGRSLSQPPLQLGSARGPS